MRIAVDRERCIASGICSLGAPQLFDHDDDGIAFARIAEPPPELEDAARAAVLECPASAVLTDPAAR